jgi:hypothetical protein
LITVFLYIVFYTVLQIILYCMKKWYKTMYNVPIAVNKVSLTSGLIRQYHMRIRKPEYTEKK